MEAREKIKQFIETANKTELVFVTAYILAKKGPLLQGCDRPASISRGDCKRLIRHIRSIQASRPEDREMFETAIHFIRREWLHREA